MTEQDRKKPSRFKARGKARPSDRANGARKDQDRKPRSERKPDPRFAAYRALKAIIHDGNTLDGALDEIMAHPANAQMEARDRGLARLLIATVLRRGRSFNRIIDGHLDRPLANKARDARILLMLGAAQLLVLKTPAHAAINTTVTLAKSNRKTLPFAGMINAVLRKVAADVDTFETMETVRQDAPGWLWRRWIAHRSEENALSLLTACLTEPALDITTKPGLEQAVANVLGAQVLPTGSLRLTPDQVSGPIDRLPGFTDGDWWVQDAASALPVRLLGDLTGKRVLDLCAAPGGKTMQLCAAGADVTALDISSDRLKRLRANLARTGLNAHIALGDATAYVPDEPFDVVLLDAPCTATGTLRRHPDKLWRGDIDLAASVALQDRMLDHAVSLLKPGGVLLYCTCSLEPEEGEERIKAFVARQPDIGLERLTVDSAPGIEPFVTKGGTVRMQPDHWPEWGGLDGFFAARMRKA